MKMTSIGTYNKNQESLHTISISLEDIVNKMNLNKENKRLLYEKMMKCNGIDPKEGKIVWDEAGNITGFKLTQPIEYIELIISLDEEGMEIKSDE